MSTFIITLYGRRIMRILYYNIQYAPRASVNDQSSSQNATIGTRTQVKSSHDCTLYKVFHAREALYIGRSSCVKKDNQILIFVYTNHIYIFEKLKKNAVLNLVIYISP